MFTQFSNTVDSWHFDRLTQNGKMTSQKYFQKLSIFPTQSHNSTWNDRRRGARGGSSPQKVLIYWKSGQNPWKSGQHFWKSGQKLRPSLFNFKNGAQRLQKHTWRFLWRSYQKMVCRTKTFRARLGKIGQKSFAPIKICLLLHLWLSDFGRVTIKMWNRLDMTYFSVTVQGAVTFHS